MYTVETTNQFEKDFKKCKKRGLKMEKLNSAISILSETGKLPEQYRPHKLSGNMAELWECHIGPDWLLVWDQNDNELRLLMMHTGTHSDIFK